MASNDSLGLVPYGFEPEYTASELEMLENNVTSDSECSDDGDWCVCENCVEMSSRDENVCCRSSEICCGTLEEYQCITEHRHFGEIVLNPVILEVKLKQRSFKSSEHINEKGDGPYRGFDY